MFISLSAPRNNWKSALTSVLSAMFGVQSEQTRKQDFQQQSWLRLIIIGVLSTVGFVLILLTIVSFVLST